MDLFEYQAKELFAEYGVPVQRGRVAATPAEASAIAAGFAAEGSPLAVVKAQVKTGGRGKAGGVKLANGPEETEAKACRDLAGLGRRGSDPAALHGYPVRGEQFLRLILKQVH